MITPSHFPADPLGWAGNQAGHMAICLVASYWIAVVFWIFYHEYPYRWQVALVIAVTYLIIELPQRGGFWDTIEDIIFVVGYGTVMFVFPFKEVAAGERTLNFDPFSIMPAAIIVTVHLLLGMSIRLWQMFATET